MVVVPSGTSRKSIATFSKAYLIPDFICPNAMVFKKIHFNLIRCLVKELQINFNTDLQAGSENIRVVSRCSQTSDSISTGNP